MLRIDDIPQRVADDIHGFAMIRTRQFKPKQKVAKISRIGRVYLVSDEYITTHKRVYNQPFWAVYYHHALACISLWLDDMYFCIGDVSFLKN